MHVAVGEVSARRAAACHGKEQARRSNWWIVERVKASALLESDQTTCSSSLRTARSCSVPRRPDQTGWSVQVERRIMHMLAAGLMRVSRDGSAITITASTCMLCVPSVSRHPARSRHVRTVYLSADWEQLAPARPAGRRRAISKRTRSASLGRRAGRPVPRPDDNGGRLLGQRASERARGRVNEHARSTAREDLTGGPDPCARVSCIGRQAS
jgi:hypothetical protein